MLLRALRALPLIQGRRLAALLLFAFSFSCQPLVAFRGDGEPRISPNAPVVNFLYPRFSDEGFTQWILRGAKAHYDSEEQIRVDEMRMRLFTGDERMAVEMEMSSPEATIRLQENRAFSDTAIRIEGDRFNLAGEGWEWLGEARRIEILRDAAVSFSDTLPDALGATATRSEDSDTSIAMQAIDATRIRSHRMTLHSSETHHTFTFREAVDVRSRDWLLTSQFLEATIDAPPGGPVPETGVDLTGKLNHAIARESVEIIQFDRTATAAEAEFFPREDRVILRGRPQVKLPGAFVTGSTIELQEGEALIRGSQADGRAQLILMQTGGLGIQGTSSLASETIVLADQIRLSEHADGNRFFFEGRVAVLSGALEMDAGSLTVYTRRDVVEGDEGAEVSSVQRMVATDSVRIEQAGQNAEAERVEFFPLEERALLTGQPRLYSGDSEIRAHTIELRPGVSVARSERGGDPVAVTLPDLPDLGYRDPQQANDTQPAIPTLINSRIARMESADEQTRFIFTDEVDVKATNLTLQSDTLVVYAVPDSTQPRSSTETSTTPPLRIERINAIGQVSIRQEDRSASAGQATFLPDEGRVILEDRPQVEQPGMGKVTGHRMVLLQGQRRALVEGGPDGERARITLPPLE